MVTLCPSSKIPGLELFLNVLNEHFQKRLIEYIDEQLVKGREGKLPGKSYDTPPPSWSKSGQSREMIQYGYYTNNNRVYPGCKVADMDTDPIMKDLIDLLIEQNVIKSDEKPDQCTVNVYSPGMWLPPHVDNSKFIPPLVTVSLVSEQSVVFGKVIDGENGVWKGEEHLSMPVGSALRVGGEAIGPVYKHAIPKITERRISFTLRRLSAEVKAKALAERQAIDLQRQLTIQQKRKLKKEKKAAKKAAKEKRKQERAEAELRKKLSRRRAASTISAKSTPLPPGFFRRMKKRSNSFDNVKNYVNKMKISENNNDKHNIDDNIWSHRPFCEKEHVQSVYDSIAAQWHGTRYKPWPKVAAFIERQPKGSLFGDIGCGNGKNWMACVELCGGYNIGSDFSMELLKICNGRDQEVHSSDALHLPYRDEIFDAVLSIAVLHHISSKERRLRLMAENLRVLRPGGQALFYAWAFEQELSSVSGHIFEEQDVLVPWHVKIGKPNLTLEQRVIEAKKVVENAIAEHGEVDESKGAAVFQRYCHVYEEGELERLFNEMIEREGIKAKIVESYHDTGNWAMCIEKLL